MAHSVVQPTPPAEVPEPPTTIADPDIVVRTRTHLFTIMVGDTMEVFTAWGAFLDSRRLALMRTAAWKATLACHGSVPG